jgi:hypothetical protein
MRLRGGLATLLRAISQQVFRLETSPDGTGGFERIFFARNLRIPELREISFHSRVT